MCQAVCKPDVSIRRPTHVLPCSQSIKKRTERSPDHQNRMGVHEHSQGLCSHSLLSLGRRYPTQGLPSAPLHTQQFPCCRARNSYAHLSPQPEAAGISLPFLSIWSCMYCCRVPRGKVPLPGNSAPVVLYLIGVLAIRWLSVECCEPWCSSDDLRLLINALYSSQSHVVDYCDFNPVQEGLCSQDVDKLSSKVVLLNLPNASTR